MTNILGISAFFHDSAAALVRDGEIVAAAQEERFSRVKHDHTFPSKAIDYCLEEAGITPDQLDYVGFYEKPLLKFDRLLETYLTYSPVGFRSFLMAIPRWLRHTLHVPRIIHAGLHHQYTKRVVFPEHHESHGASAFYPSPFEEAAILTLDGVGEWATATYGVGRGHRLDLTHALHFPHSLGLLYSAFTYYCGFRVNSGEYKLMGLAPHGEPKYEALILERLMDLKEDGSFRLDLSYFNYCQGLTMTSGRFHRLFGAPPRSPDSELTQHYMDVAASIQRVTETVVLRAASHLHSETGLPNLCLAGGVALNCVCNGRLLRESPFENVWIQPAAGDAGGALGVALFIWYQLLGNERTVTLPDGQQGSLLGPRYGAEEIRTCLDASGASYEHYTDQDALCEAVADLLVGQQVVGLFQGRMEYGPRALGSRSIIGDARRPQMQSLINQKIKFRESFRPLAPSVLRERVHEYFETPPEQDRPYMLTTAQVQPDKRRPQDPSRQGLDRIDADRSELSAATHVDYSARIQTVDSERNPRYYTILKAFERKTGCPVLLNTSFNVRGEPMVCSPDQALDCFGATGMDALVLENFLLRKGDQPEIDPRRRDDYLARFGSD